MFLLWGIHLQAEKSSQTRLVVLWLHRLHRNCWLLWLRNDQTSAMKWSPGLQRWHHLVNLFQYSLLELISVRAVLVLTVCCGERHDIRVAGLFLDHFRTLSQSCEILSWCQSWNGARSDLAITSVSTSALFSATEAFSSSLSCPPAFWKDHQSYNFPLHSSVFLLTQASVTCRGSAEPSESFFPKGCQ